MMKFEFQYEKGSPKVTMILGADSTLDEVLPNIEGFLKACGYVFDGELQIVEKEKD